MQPLNPVHEHATSLTTTVFLFVHSNVVTTINFSTLGTDGTCSHKSLCASGSDLRWCRHCQQRLPRYVCLATQTRFVQLHVVLFESPMVVPRSWT